MINIMPAINLVSMMTDAEYYILVKYMNGDFEIISGINKYISDSMYGYDKHLYFKDNTIYYWETNILASKGKNNINVSDLYEIDIDEKQINKLFKDMYHELSDKLGSKYSDAFIERRNRLYNKFTSKESVPISHPGNRLEILEIGERTIPNKIKRTEIEVVYSIVLKVLDINWNYIIDYNLIDMRKVK